VTQVREIKEAPPKSVTSWAALVCRIGRVVRSSAEAQGELYEKSSVPPSLLALGPFPIEAPVDRPTCDDLLSIIATRLPNEVAMVTSSILPAARVSRPSSKQVRSPARSGAGQARRPVPGAPTGGQTFLWSGPRSAAPEQASPFLRLVRPPQPRRPPPPSGDAGSRSPRTAH
jgi:hypothetical protein